MLFVIGIHTKCTRLICKLRKGDFNVCIFDSNFCFGISVICTPCMGGGTDEQLIEL